MSGRLAILLLLFLVGCGNITTPSVAQTLSQFKEKQLHVEDNHTMTPEEFGVIPVDAACEAIFFWGGADGKMPLRMYCCPEAQQTTFIRNMYERFGESSPILASHTCEKHGILLQTLADGTDKDNFLPYCDAIP